MSNTVIKRNGERVPFDLSKWQNQIQRVCKNKANVSAFTIAANAKAQFNEEMTTIELDEIALKSMVDLIDSETNPLGHTDYQFPAGHQRNIMLRKNVFGSDQIPHIYEIVKTNVELGLYTPELLEWYSEDEWDKIEKIIKHDRDFTYAYSQVEQFVDKYLVRNRATGKIVETPQIRYIIAAATAFHAETKNRLTWVKDFYEFSSKGYFTLATPVCAGLGTATKQFSSCVVISAGDDMDSIYAAGQAMAKYAGKRAGIGFEFGEMRGLGAPIRNGEIMHTGIIPFVKKWYSDLRSVSQGGIRNGSATMHMPIWHYQFNDFIVLKNNQGTEETRVRQLDYCVQMAAMFWERLLDPQGIISFFDPHDVPGLYDLFHTNIKEFEKAYVAAENNVLIRRKQETSEEVLRAWVLAERSGTGRIYVNNVDNIQFQSPYNPETDTVRQSNLCQEIFIVSKSFKSLDDPEGLIGLCTLGSLSWGKFKNPEEMRKPIRSLYRALHNLLQYQDFLVPQSKRHNEMYEPLGIGVTDLAHWHAQRDFNYGDELALAEVKKFMEHQYFYLMEMNVELAKEKGACSRSHATRYAEGKFMFDLRAEGVNELTDFTPDSNLQWEPLRKDMMTYGVRNSTTGAIAPVESSSLLILSTNGPALPKTLISNKTSKGGKIVQVVPEYEQLKQQYQKLLLWSQESPIGYLKTMAVLQVYLDQGISIDMFYNPKETETGEMKIDVNDVITAHILASNWGLKSLYYFLVNKQLVIDRLKVSYNQFDDSPIFEEIEDDYCESCVL